MDSLLFEKLKCQKLNFRSPHQLIMKKLTILFLFCCMQIVNAQSYQSIFGDSTTQFKLFIPYLSCKTVSDDSDELGEGYTMKILFRKGNDTVINNQTYRIANTSDNFFPDNNYAFVREDTLSGKIYSHVSRFDKEYLVCDMSLSVGDTFCLHDLYTLWNAEPTHGYMIVNSIIYLDGKKVIYFGDIYADKGFGWVSVYPTIVPDKIYFMEGIGPLFGVIDYRNPNGVELLSLLLCVHKEDSLVYIRNSESSYGCDYYSISAIINEPLNITLYVYPNPVKEQLIIKNDEFIITRIQIFDMFGILILDIISQNESEIVLDMKSYLPGFYFFKAITNERSIVKKIIKQ